MRLLVRTALFLTCILQMPSAWAETERAYPIITYTCDSKDDVLKIKNEVKWGKAGKDFAFSAKNGTYSPWQWVDIVERNERKLVRQSKSLELNCKLSGITYRVVLKPKLFNPDFNGQCGDKLSVKVSVYAGDTVLLENKEMERFCRGNTKVIRGIKVYGKQRRIKLYEVPRHKFY